MSQGEGKSESVNILADYRTVVQDNTVSMDRLPTSPTDALADRPVISPGWLALVLPILWLLTMAAIQWLGVGPEVPSEAGGTNGPAVVTIVEQGSCREHV